MLRRVEQALGISVHTGWAACVVVAGSLQKPQIVQKRIIDILGDDERFCFHMAADMPRGKVEPFLAKLRKKALEAARRALAPLSQKPVAACALIAKPGAPGELEHILAAHPRLHTAEGCFYRDVLSEACSVPVQLVSPASLDISGVGKLSGPPWGKDQKLAALAAWTILKGKPAQPRQR
jgi:hypothetical protein